RTRAVCVPLVRCALTSVQICSRAGCSLFLCGVHKRFVERACSWRADFCPPLIYHVFKVNNKATKNVFVVSLSKADERGTCSFLLDNFFAAYLHFNTLKNVCGAEQLFVFPMLVSSEQRNGFS
ncbi:unnamed protein product, partial [Callosobruchus maculatus]